MRVLDVLLVVGVADVVAGTDALLVVGVVLEVVVGVAVVGAAVAAVLVPLVVVPVVPVVVMGALLDVELALVYPEVLPAVVAAGTAVVNNKPEHAKTNMRTVSDLELINIYTPRTVSNQLITLIAV